MILKKFCKCGKIIAYAKKRCDKCEAIYQKYLVAQLLNEKERLKEKEKFKRYRANRTDKREQDFYNSKEWKLLRDRVKSRANGLCEICLNNGIINHYEDIHHIVPIKDDWNKRLDINNVICICRKCHKKLHREIEKNKNKFYK